MARGISGRPLARQAMAYVLAGGRGSRLLELTDKRAKPAVYFGGKLRIIDFALSNALNSGIRRIAVATQYKAHSLIRHLQQGWNFFRPERNESFDILPASQRVSGEHWYRGTADAVFQNTDIIQSYSPEYMVILAGDHIYMMDYELMLQQHVGEGADVTVGCATVPCAEARAFGVMHVDASDRIISFLEKPANPPPMPGDPDRCLVSMGIYVFKTSFLFDVLKRDAVNGNSSHDFGKDIIPGLVREAKAVAHPLDRSYVRGASEAGAYWRDVGTVDAYFEANLDLTCEFPDLDLYDTHWPIWTYSEMTPPAKFVRDAPDCRGTATCSIVAGGSIISGATIHDSVLFSRVRVQERAEVRRGVVFPQVEIGRGARLSNVIIDRGIVIPEGLVVGEDPERDASRFRRTENGVCLITKPMIDQLAH
jgi:glucose-1-phosphate adenylyltransferase